MALVLQPVRAALSAAYNVSYVTDCPAATEWLESPRVTARDTSCLARSADERHRRAEAEAAAAAEVANQAVWSADAASSLTRVPCVSLKCPWQRVRVCG